MEYLLEHQQTLLHLTDYMEQSPW